MLISILVYLFVYLIKRFPAGKNIDQNNNDRNYQKGMD